MSILKEVCYYKKNNIKEERERENRESNEMALWF